MKNAHPYEEVAYDLVSLQNKNQEIGSGVIAELQQPMNPLLFLRDVKEKMNCGVIKYTDLHKKEVNKVAICGGAGSFLLQNAKRAKADVFITSDFKYHEFFDAEKQIIIADIGHYESEQYTGEIFYELISKKFTNIAVILSKVNTNPVKYL